MSMNPTKSAELKWFLLAVVVTLAISGTGAYFLYQKFQEAPAEWSAERPTVEETPVKTTLLNH